MWHGTGQRGPLLPSRPAFLYTARAPTTGRIEVLGEQPAADPAQLARVGYVAQDTPTYANLSVADHLKLGAKMNPRWDQRLAQARIEQLELDPKQKAGKLSGGQRWSPPASSSPARPRTCSRSTTGSCALAARTPTCPQGSK